jgi:signal transduction histidine kinase
MTAPAAAGSRRRSRRDWAADCCLFLLAAGTGAVLAWLAAQEPGTPHPALAVDQVAGALACAALWLRRRWPVGLALALIPVAAVFDFASGAQLAALFTVAVHRPGRVTAAVGGLSLCAGMAYTLARPPRDLTPAWTAGLVLFWAAVSLAVIGWGISVRHRRQLDQSRRERAARAGEEARLRAQQAQYEVRAQIAREMHDVLGHRLSLLSVHAGALELSGDAPREEIARAAAVIRASAHQAMQDLREVVGVLRAPMDGLPQPTLASLPGLVAESVHAGMAVRLSTEANGSVPDSVGRTAYRIVQEGLTNARKHAPGSAVTVRVAGAPGTGLTVEVGNPPAGTSAVSPPGDGAAPAPAADGAGPGPLAGAGQGLAGLAERVALAAGRLEYGPTSAGGFRLCAWLPWPT